MIGLFKARYGLVLLSAGALLACVSVTAMAAPISWQLHVPESLDEAMSQPAVPSQPSVDVSEAHWRSAVVSHLLAKNLTGAQQTLNEAPMNGVPVSLLTSRAAWLLGLGLVPWAQTALDEASRYNSELDSTQAKQLHGIQSDLLRVYVAEQTPQALLRECAEILPALMMEKPNEKAYQQWQVLEGLERLSPSVQLMRQQLATIADSSSMASSSTEASDEPVFPASLKPSLYESIRTLQASQRVLNNAAGVVDIGLHQRRLTPMEYNHQCAELIDFLTQQQQRVAQYKNRLQRRSASVPSGNSALASWKNAVGQSLALLTLHEAGLAALRESIEAPFASALTSSPVSAAAAIAKKLPLQEATVLQQWQSASNVWEPLSFSQALLEMGLPLSLSKALTLDTSRAVRVLTTPLPAPIEGIGGKKGKSSKTK